MDRAVRNRRVPSVAIATCTPKRSFMPIPANADARRPGIVIFRRFRIVAPGWGLVFHQASASKNHQATNTAAKASKIQLIALDERPFRSDPQFGQCL